MNFWLNLSKPAKAISLAICIIILALGTYLFFGVADRGSQTNQIKQGIAYKRDKPMLPSGAQSYEFIQNQIVSPRIKFLTVDPLDAKPGEIQRFNAVVVSDFNPSYVNIETEDDAGVETMELKKQPSGTIPSARYSVDSDNNLALFPKSESTSSVVSFWSGERTVKNTASNKFVINIKIKETTPDRKDKPLESGVSIVKGANRFGNVQLSWSNACNISLGGDWDSSGQCAISYTDGVDNGNILVRNYSAMVLDADFGLNPGKSAIFEPLGVIAINTKAQIKQGYIWKLESDVFGIGEVISEKSPGSKYKRRYEFTSGGYPVESEKLKSSFFLPKGKQIFQISSAEVAGPKIIQATIDPLDVKVGDTQNLSLVVRGAAPIVSVSAKIETDNGVISLPLSLEGPTSKAELLPEKIKIVNGELVMLDDLSSKKNIAIPGVVAVDASTDSGNLTYTGSWIVKDTHSAIYHTIFIVRDANGLENSINMAWSDPCSTFTAGNRALNTCSFSDVDGADNGDLTINSGKTVTMLSGATLVFNPGKKIIVSGIIAVANTAQIIKSYLWRTDADGDSWAASPTLVAQSSQPAGKVRAYTAPNASDCYDYNSTAYPGYSGYYQDVDRGDGSFDYNCDGYISMESTVSVAVTCSYNGTVYPTCDNLYATGWCDVVSSGPGGTNYPYCSGAGGYPGCGVIGNFYYSGYGCVQGLYGGVYYRNDRVQGCK